MTVRTSPAPEPTPFVATLLGSTLGPDVVAAIRLRLDAAGLTPVAERTLSTGPLIAVELRLCLPGGAAPAELAEELQAIRTQSACDLVLQPDLPSRCRKRLAVFDMDSTLIQQEVIDELARQVGAFDRVADITRRAMAGELAFDAALRERVALLRGAPVQVLTDVLAAIAPTPGVERLLPALRRMGCKTAVLSGGFLAITEPIRQRLGLDFAHANELEVIDGHLSGRVIGPIVNRQRKAQLLREIAAQEGVALADVMAVGDGANDLDMLAAAGLGVAFCAKPVVQRAAPAVINQPRLDAVLYLLGLTDAEIDAE